MSKSVVVTARIDEKTSGDLDRLAQLTERSRAWLVAKALEEFVRAELEFHAFVQEGIDDLENGRWISQEDLRREIEERRLRRAA